ncbi:major facilitator superfamily protein [Klebsiella pneumoniae subsp. rhinoscleromatis]|nr:major facilitator superfamily protein [Klebsiella pneumoniae subsp. rhinoscleromatis]
MVALAWYGLFSLLMATQSSAEGVIFFRFLVGIGLGIELVTIGYLPQRMGANPSAQ